MKILFPWFPNIEKNKVWLCYFPETIYFYLKFFRNYYLFSCENKMFVIMSPNKKKFWHKRKNFVEKKRIEHKNKTLVVKNVKHFEILNNIYSKMSVNTVRFTLIYTQSGEMWNFYLFETMYTYSCTKRTMMHEERNQRNLVHFILPPESHGSFSFIITHWHHKATV